MRKEDVKEAVKEAMNEQFVAYGFRVLEPNEMQADMLYLRKMRVGSEAIGKHALRAIVGVVVPTGLYILWGWLKSHFTEATI